MVPCKFLHILHGLFHHVCARHGHVFRGRVAHAPGDDAEDQVAGVPLAGVARGVCRGWPGQYLVSLLTIGELLDGDGQRRVLVDAVLEFVRLGYGAVD